MNTCKGICKARAFREGGATWRDYLAGRKVCMECNVVVQSDETRCPCCRLPYRTKSRGSPSKRESYQVIARI